MARALLAGWLLLTYFIGLNLLWAGFAMSERSVLPGVADFLTGLTVIAMAVLSRWARHGRRY